MNSKRLLLLTPLLIALALIAGLAVPNPANLTATSPTHPTGPVATAPRTVAAVPVAYAGTVYLTFDDGPS